jgi:hypothetical protein
MENWQEYNLHLARMQLLTLRKKAGPSDSLPVKFKLTHQKQKQQLIIEN